MLNHHRNFTAKARQAKSWVYITVILVYLGLTSLYCTWPIFRYLAEPIKKIILFVELQAIGVPGDIISIINYLLLNFAIAGLDALVLYKMRPERIS